MSLFNKETKRQPDLKLYTIYDSKTESYGQPSFAVNQHDLTRQIVNMFKDPSQNNNKFLTNAEDYSIFEIGDFCFKTGTIDPANPTHIVNMHELRAIAQKDTPKPAEPQMALLPT